MITYEKRSNVSTKVLLENKLVGHIKIVEKGYAYFPKNSQTCGQAFKSLAACKRSLES